METRYVETALAVARRGSFSAVARERHMAQSTISRHVAALEAEVGELLFHRRAGLIEPTDAGRAFLEGADALVGAALAAVAAARRARPSDLEGATRTNSSVPIGPPRRVSSET